MRLSDHSRLNPVPVTDPANAPARAEFKLGIFPPGHHVPPAAPTPMQQTPPAK
jgi:hypothetical protein